MKIRTLKCNPFWSTSPDFYLQPLKIALVFIIIIIIMKHLPLSYFILSLSPSLSSLSLSLSVSLPLSLSLFLSLSLSASLSLYLSLFFSLFLSLSLSLSSLSLLLIYLSYTDFCIPIAPSVPGTHYLTSVTAGAALVKDDFIKRDFVATHTSDKPKILAFASSSFYKLFNLGFSYQ